MRAYLDERTAQKVPLISEIDAQIMLRTLSIYSFRPRVFDLV